MHACVKKGAKVWIHIYRTHGRNSHFAFQVLVFWWPLQYTYWFFVDPFSTCIGFLLTPSVLKSTLVLKGSRKKPIPYWYFVDPFSKSEILLLKCPQCIKKYIVTPSLLLKSSLDKNVKYHISSDKTCGYCFLAAYQPKRP